MTVDRIETYLREATEAERNAVTTEDPSLRSDYLRLAQGWRRLAREARQSFANDDDDAEPAENDLSHG